MSALTKKKLLVPLLAVLAILVPFLTARSFRSPVAAASSSSILSTHDGSLTSYLVGASTIQDVAPLPIQRGVNLDGSMRAGSTHPMHLAGNPFGSAWSANQTLNGIRTVTGTYSPTDVDIALPATGPGWVVGRTYDNRQYDGGQHTSDGYQGSPTGSRLPSPRS
jgi:hypothetical protein